MRVFIFTCFAAVLFSCNSSSKKEPSQVMDDTTRKDNPPTNTQPVVAIEPVKISAAYIPSSIKIKGIVEEAWKWNDNLGENLLITSSVDKYRNKSNQESWTSELHAFHYTKKDGDYVQVWVMSDAEKDCEFDITCEFLKGAASITDLDADGVAETTVQYKLACRSDVSPAYMKLIMYEGENKYSLRGSMWVKASDDEKFEVTEKDANLETLPGYKKTEDEYYKTYGRYESEKDFAAAPPEFLVYARQQWMKFVKESFE